MLGVLAAIARLTLEKPKNKVLFPTFVVQWCSIHRSTAERIR
jgi:hypothetical protein